MYIAKYIFVGCPENDKLVIKEKFNEQLVLIIGHNNI